MSSPRKSCVVVVGTRIAWEKDVEIVVCVPMCYFVEKSEDGYVTSQLWRGEIVVMEGGVSCEV